MSSWNLACVLKVLGLLSWSSRQYSRLSNFWCVFIVLPLNFLHYLLFLFAATAPETRFGSVIVLTDIFMDKVSLFFLVVYFDSRMLYRTHSLFGPSWGPLDQFLGLPLFWLIGGIRRQGIEIRVWPLREALRLPQCVIILRDSILVLPSLVLIQFLLLLGCNVQ